MSSFIDLTGKQFGKWFVIKEGGKTKHNEIKWLCRCDCGTEREVIGNSLRRSHSTNCGCIRKERMQEMAKEGIGAVAAYRLQTEKSRMTGDPSKYPQGYFREKHCKHCGDLFSPVAPSELYCSDECANYVANDKYLKRQYGITRKDYDNMYNEQKGVCKICGGEGFSMHKSKYAVKLVVDHDHDTGEVRGLLCHNCNRALGLLQDSVDNLQSAIEYLKTPLDN